MKYNSTDRPYGIDPHLFCPGAEIRAFDPRRVPTLNCSMTKEEEVLDLGCDNESDCNEDLGVQCLRNELLDEILGSEPTTHVQTGKRYSFIFNNNFIIMLFF